MPDFCRGIYFACLVEQNLLGSSISRDPDPVRVALNKSGLPSAPNISSYSGSSPGAVKIKSLRSVHTSINIETI